MNVSIKSIYFSLFLAMSMGLAACTPKVSVDGGPGPDLLKPPGGAADTADKVQGPALDGEWASACVPLTFINQGRSVEAWGTIKLAIAGKSVTRKTEYFQDSKCQASVSTKEQKGTFHYLEKTEPDVYQVEYKFDMGNGVSAMPQEGVRLVNNLLFIGNFNSKPYIALARQGSPVVSTGSGADLCLDRKNAMSTLQAQAQTEADAAFSNAMKGIPARPATQLRQKIDEFESKYSSSDYDKCDGETAASFARRARQTANEIDRMS